MRADQLHILQHALGVDGYGRGEQYRNHFCAGGADIPICESLEHIGLMARYPERNFIPYPNFYVTDAGKVAMRDASPPPPKLTRSQKRYQRFLDHDCDMSFSEWLRTEGSAA